MGLPTTLSPPCYNARVMIYRGTVRNGVVVLEENGAPLREGTPVRVEPLSADVADGQTADAAVDDYVRRMMEIAGTAEGLPGDLARNHDHYLHGHPKK